MLALTRGAFGYGARGSGANNAAARKFAEVGDQRCFDGTYGVITDEQACELLNKDANLATALPNIPMRAPEALAGNSRGIQLFA